MFDPSRLRTKLEIKRLFTRGALCRRCCSCENFHARASKSLQLFANACTELNTITSLSNTLILAHGSRLPPQIEISGTVRQNDFLMIAIVTHKKLRNGKHCLHRRVCST